MTIENKLNSISASKAAIKAAIQEKGVSCDDTLAEYANRIKAIPNPEIEDEVEISNTSSSDYSFDYVSNRSHVVPHYPYDAMKRVSIVNDVRNLYVGINQGGIPQIASGVSFSVGVDNEGLRFLILYLHKDDDITHAVYTANIAFSDGDKYLILYEYSADGLVVEKLWLAQYAYNTASQYLTITVLQQITITQ